MGRQARRGFTCAQNLAGDKESTLDRFVTYAMQHAMIWVGLGLMPGTPAHPDDDAANLNRMGHFKGAGAQAGDVGPDEAPGPGDLATARHLGRRVAEQAARLRP